MGREEQQEEPEEKAEAPVIKQTYGDAAVPMPDLRSVPDEYRDRIRSLFSVWADVRARNAILSQYYEMETRVKDLGISIPESLTGINCVTGWCKKAIDAHAVRSVFDGYVFGGEGSAELDSLVRGNRMRSKYAQAATASLEYGLSAFTVMKGAWGQPSAMVRCYSANQFAALWDKDAERIGCGVVLADVDGKGRASKYVAHFPDSVVTMTRSGESWSSHAEKHMMGRPMMEVMPFEASIDKPLGHSMLTPEIRGIVDKAMRDVLRMEVGAEFFTFPQRYVLGASEGLFGVPSDDGDGDGYVPDEAAKFRAYIGALLAISRDENGDVPQVGQFPAPSADNFTRVFENDAQRFSGASNVPLAQLGVLSNTYTSSDALGAANDPLILKVEEMNRSNAEVMETVAMMMLAVSRGVRMDELGDDAGLVQAYFKDPSMPTIAARADAWTKLGGADGSIVGTRVYYEGVGLSQATIDRLDREKRYRGAIATLGQIADGLGRHDSAR